MQTAPLNAEILTTGTELLLGEIVDTNSAWIARELTGVGVNLFYVVTVGDNEARIRDAVTTALSRSDVVIVTGGLGPTVDDRTRHAIAAATDRPLVLDREALQKIEARFAAWGKTMTENNTSQALIPSGATIIENDVGTAPGFLVEHEGGAVIALPGVPREMKHLMAEWVLPHLSRKTGAVGVIRRRVLRTIGVGESVIDQELGDLMKQSNPTVGLAAHGGQTDVRITVRAASEDQAEAELDALQSEIEARIGSRIYSTTAGETIEAVVVRGLRESGHALALVETNTGGRLRERLLEALGEPDSVVRGEVRSADEVSEAQALAVLESMKTGPESTLELVLLGTAGRDEGVYGSAPGETWLALRDASGVETVRLPFGGTDDLSAVWLCNRALDLVRGRLDA